MTQPHTGEFVFDPEQFNLDGFAVENAVVSPEQCDLLIAHLPAIESSGSRTLLNFVPFRDLARKLREHNDLSTCLTNLVAVQCILFNKSTEQNWSVGLHRDGVLPVQGEGSWQPSGIKEGMRCVKPPREFVDRCIAIRVQLDGAPDEDISVVPGSHRDERSHSREEAHAVVVQRGGALFMRPSIAHASSKLQKSERRRVLHYVFAPRDLPEGYSWYDAV